MVTETIMEQGSENVSEVKTLPILVQWFAAALTLATTIAILLLTFSPKRVKIEGVDFAKKSLVKTEDEMAASAVATK